MRKIIYPFGNDISKKIRFNKIYYDLLKSKIDESRLNILLKKIDHSYSLESLLLSDFSELINIQKKIKSSTSLNEIKSFFIKGTDDKPTYLYDGLQPLISGFFMSENIPLKSCHYCNIDYINTFEEHYQFSSKKDFILNAPKELLMMIKEISEETADKIIANRGFNDFLKVFRSIFGKIVYSRFYEWYNRKIIENPLLIDLNNIVVKKNHYTLDHILPKSQFSFLSLSIYNLVPSCSSCNTKFKHMKEFTINEELLKISPTSNDFKLNNLLNFQIKFDVNEPDFDEKIKKIKQIEDVEMNIENLQSLKSVDEFLEIFKIKSRYNFHKNIPFDLINKRKDYSDSQLEEIEKIFYKAGIFIDKNKFKNQVFGSVIFEALESNEPFEKYKKDIAKQLGLI